MEFVSCEYENLIMTQADYRVKVTFHFSLQQLHIIDPIEPRKKTSEILGGEYLYHIIGKMKT